MTMIEEYYPDNPYGRYAADDGLDYDRRDDRYVGQDTARSMAKALGWFSLALGAAELLAPGTIKRDVGTPGPKEVVTAYGLREIGAGVAILASEKPVSMVWGRVAGDVLDLLTLAPALSRNNPHRTAAVGALGFVAVATAMDVFVAMQGDAPDRH